MGKSSHQDLKRQDILLLLKLISKGSDRPAGELAQQIGISAAECSFALGRLKAAGLVRPGRGTKEPIKANALEFILSGLKYVYPTRISGFTKGLPTANSVSPIADKASPSFTEQYVWETGHGSAKGQGVEPLYRTVPKAAFEDPKLHKMLAMIDVLRIEGAEFSDKDVASKELAGLIMA